MVELIDQDQVWHKLADDTGQSLYRYRQPFRALEMALVTGIDSRSERDGEWEHLGRHFGGTTAEWGWFREMAARHGLIPLPSFLFVNRSPGPLKPEGPPIPEPAKVTEEEPRRGVPVEGPAGLTGMEPVDFAAAIARLHAGIVALEQHIYPSVTPLRWSASGDHRPAGELQYAHEGDAGIDLHVAETTEVEPGRVYNIPLGVRVQPPEGTWYLIHGRSSAIDRGLTVLTGIIDYGYRGPLYARVIARRPMTITRGERVCQLVLFPLVQATLIEHVGIDELNDTARGDGGFGSTGT